MCLSICFCLNTEDSGTHPDYSRVMRSFVCPGIRLQNRLSENFVLYTEALDQVFPRASVADRSGAGSSSYCIGREPAMRMSTSRLALFRQSGLEDTLATP